MFIYVEANEKEKSSDRSFEFIEINDEVYTLSSCFGAGVDIDDEAKGHFYFICQYKNIRFKVYTESHVENNQIKDKYFILEDTYHKLRNKYYGIKKG